MREAAALAGQDHGVGGEAERRRHPGRSVTWVRYLGGRAKEPRQDHPPFFGGTVSDLLAITTWVYGEGPRFKLLVPSPLCCPPSWESSPPWTSSPRAERVGVSQRGR